MFRLKCLTVLALAVTQSSTVKVKMQGSLNLGEDVLSTLTHYIQDSLLASKRANRRSGISGYSKIIPIDPDSERIKWTVDSETFCREVPFCDEPHKISFIVDYVTLLGNAVESIFNSVLSPAEGKTSSNPTFVHKLRHILHDVHGILLYANSHVKEKKEPHQWVSVLKRISAKFQDAALVLVFEKLPGDSKDVHNVRKKLIQKLVIAIIIVENRYETRLCTDLQMCIHDHIITESLYTFLDYFSDATDERAREFVKYFYESLPEDFFYFTDEDTGHEFQIILSEMSFTPTVPTREILLSVLQTVEARKFYLKTHNDTMKGYDSQLLNIILSDMDNFYYHTKHKKFPFETFMDIFSGWLRSGGRLGSHIRQVIKDLKKKLATQPRDLSMKLGNEVRVFLELTVDSDN